MRNWHPFDNSFSRVLAFSSRILSVCDLLPLRKTDLYCSVCLSFLFSINTSFLSSRFDILIFTSPDLPFPLDFKRDAATTFTDSFIELTSSLAIASISSLGSWIMFVAMIWFLGHWPSVYCRVREWILVAYGLRSQAHSRIYHGIDGLFHCIFLGLLFTNFRLKDRLHCFELFIDTGY